MFNRLTLRDKKELRESKKFAKKIEVLLKKQKAGSEFRYLIIILLSFKKQKTPQKSLCIGALKILFNFPPW